MNLHLQIIGCILIGIALIHAAFPKYFNWKTELEQLSLINRQMFKIHTFFIAFTVFLVGVICLISNEELINTSLGKTVCLGLGIFWGIRFLFQLFVYSSKLWRGKTFETIIHIFFTMLWLYFTIIFIYIFLK